MSDRLCANPDCDVVFEKKIHNAKYCSPECRQIITNKRVLQRYYDNKEEIRKVRSDVRYCAIESCSTRLSMYNKETKCEQHKRLELQTRLKKWGWDEDKAKGFDLI